MKIIIIFVIFFTVSSSNELPATFKKCNRNDINFNQCLGTAIQDGIRQLKNPMPELGLPSLEPVDIAPSIAVPAAQFALVSFQQNFTDYKIHELTNVTVTKANMDFGTNTLSLECSFPHVTGAARCFFAGKIGLVSISAAGPNCFVYLDKAQFNLKFVFDEYTKDDEKYFKVVDHKMSWDAESVSYRFEGDAVLGTVFNGNGMLIFDAIKDNYGPIFGGAFAKIFNGLLEKVPVSKLFDS